jgi:hypothetical protein
MRGKGAGGSLPPHMILYNKKLNGSVMAILGTYS